MDNILTINAFNLVNQEQKEFNSSLYYKYILDNKDL